MTLTAFTFDLRFPGQRYDDETGLFHNGFRDYHPGLGRYVQSDPLGLEAGWNTFAYGNLNPTTLSDPTGLKVFFDDSKDPEGSRRLEAAVLHMEANSPTFRNSMRWLRTSDNHYYFVPSVHPTKGTNSEAARLDSLGRPHAYHRNIYFSTTDTVTCAIPGPYAISPLAGIAHEVYHAAITDAGVSFKESIKKPFFSSIYNQEEINAIRYEAAVSKELGVKSRGQFWDSDLWLRMEYFLSKHHQRK